jgi:hypothetical protein
LSEVPKVVDHSALATSGRRRRRVPKWMTWSVLLAIVLCVVGLGLPNRQGHTALTQRLGLELPAGLILMIPGIALLAVRDPSLGSGRRIRVIGLFLTLVGVGLVGLGLGRLTQHDAWRALGAPAVVMIWLFLLREALQPSRSATFTRVRQQKGRVPLWLTYATTWVLLILLIPLLGTSLGLIK